MTIVRVGSTGKYAEGWDKAFARSSGPKSAAGKNKPAKKAAAKKAAPKKSGKKS